MAGIQYQADKGYSAGQAASDGQNKKRWAIPNTDVYQTERWNDDDFNYRVPIDTSNDGKVSLILKFSEVYFNQPDQKVFGVKIGDFNVIRELDPYVRAQGKFMPYDVFVELTIKQGKVYIDGKEVRNALVGQGRDRQLVVDFVQGRADNPKVNALILVKGGLENTNKDNFTRF